MENSNQLLDVFIYLSAAAVTVPGARWLGFGPVLGYLIAGILIGPWGLSLIRDTGDIRLLSEISTAAMLFLVGLELRPSIISRLRSTVLSIGVLHWVLCTVVFFMIGLSTGLEWNRALAVALAMSLSSQAMVSYFLSSKNLVDTERGVYTRSVLLAQGVLLLPLLVFMPVFGFGSTLQENLGWFGMLRLIAAVAIILFFGRYVIRYALRYLSAVHMPDMFVAFAFLLVVGIILLLQAIGSTYYVAPLIAGVLFAGSEGRGEIESAIKPFRGLMLGLFFVSMGLLVDFGLLLQYPHIVFAVLLVMLSVKAVTMVIVGRFDSQVRDTRQHWLPAVLVSPAGEFSFVLLVVAMSYQALDAELGAGMIVVVALSMMVMPVLQIAYNKQVARRLSSSQYSGDKDESVHPSQTASAVLLIGFGRVGQVVGRMLRSANIAVTAIDYDSMTLDVIDRFGFRGFCGDAMRQDLLELAGIENARVVVLAFDDSDRLSTLVNVIRSKYPQVSIVARSRDRLQQIELSAMGVEKSHRETFESAILMGEDVLNSLGIEVDETERVAEAFRDHDERLLFQEINMALEDEKTGRQRALQNRRESLRELLNRDQREFEKEQALKNAGD